MSRQMLKARSFFLMIYRPGPVAPRTQRHSTVTTRQLSTTTPTPTAPPTMSGQEAANDFIQFVNDSPTRASPPTRSPLRSLILSSAC